MWKCPTCGRIFDKAAQPHSCHKIPLEEHFRNKSKSKELFTYLVHTIDTKVGKTEILSLPCCIHLFGTYDFLAALPKRDRLEIRFSLDRKLDTPRLKQSVPVSANAFKNCIEVTRTKDVNDELIRWLRESYQLKDKANHD